MIDEEFRLPTLDEFMARDGRPNNSYLDHPEFKDLYVRKGEIVVRFNGNNYICERVITIANVEAKKKGRGAFTRLVAELAGKGLAIFVECVHNPRFRRKLLELGFIRVNGDEDYHYLLNYKGHLKEKG